MANQQITFICTVFNEEKIINQLLESLLQQTKMPDEVVIVDGGSTDKTVISIKNQVLSTKTKIPFKIIEKKGNRSVGRNEAVRNATGEIIVCSDAGCILDKNWLKSITTPFFEDPTIDVVAGYYRGKAVTAFQRCLIPYVLVMPDQIDPKRFLPASRSMAFKKETWRKVGGFPEQYSHNEDYVFAKRLKKNRAKIHFQKSAIVYWLPRTTIAQAYNMFYRFALGDAEAGILRPKVLFIFARYLFGTVLIALSFLLKSYFILYTLYFILLAYVAWAVVKNYRYVHQREAFIYLPLLQLLSDAAVLHGTVSGLLKRSKR